MPWRRRGRQTSELCTWNAVDDRAVGGRDLHDGKRIGDIIGAGAVELRRHGHAQHAEFAHAGEGFSIYDVQPQMWTYERTVDGGRTPYRAFVSIPGHLYENFNRPNYRAILLRGIAWAGKRANVDELLKQGGTRRQPSLRRRRPDRTRQGRGEPSRCIRTST